MGKNKIKPIKLPADELAHKNCAIEWWYFNGNLKDKEGKEYSFMNCLFKAELSKMPKPFAILPNKPPLKNFYFSHSLLSDIDKKKFTHRTSPLSILSLDSFQKSLLFINYLNPILKNGYINCIIEKIDTKTYHIKNEDIELYLTPQKKPLLEGGKGFMDFGLSSTYYYSITNFRTEGKIKINDKWVEVTGKSWMDHQWSEKLSKKNEWDWFSIQLADNTEIVCFRYGNEKAKIYSADISLPNGTQKNCKEVEITPGKETWTSPVSKAVYPTSWHIKLPREKIELHLKARIQNQEMLFGSMSYWEGPLEVIGTYNNKKVKGKGFMELVGYNSKYSNIRYAKDEIQKALGVFLKNI